MELVMTTTQFNKRECPYCANTLDAASHEEGIEPQVGDISMCFYCGELSLFGENEFIAVPDEKKAELRNYMGQREQHIQIILQARYQEMMKRVN
jgi:glutaredoxin